MNAFEWMFVDSFEWMFVMNQHFYNYCVVGEAAEGCFCWNSFENMLQLVWLLHWMVSFVWFFTVCFQAYFPLSLPRQSDKNMLQCWLSMLSCSPQKSTRKSTFKYPCGLAFHKKSLMDHRFINPIYSIYGMPCKASKGICKGDVLTFFPTPNWRRLPFWAIYFRWVETTT